MQGPLVLLLLVAAACTAPSEEPLPEVLSPAPTPTIRAMSGGECVVGIIRADRISAARVPEVLGGHVPRYVPRGFGLFIAWATEEDGVLAEPGSGAIWTDAGCRQIRLELYPAELAAQASPLPAEWTLVGRGRCTYGSLRDAPCLTYQRRLPNGATLSLHTAGLRGREVGSIAGSIPV